MDGGRAEEKQKKEEKEGGFLQGVKESAHRGSPRLVTVYSTGKGGFETVVSALPLILP